MVFVWYASGPARAEGGVSDDAKRARKLARASLLAANASDVLVEEAFLALGTQTLTHFYARTGAGWHGHRTPGGRITWRKFAGAGRLQARLLPREGPGGRRRGAGHCAL